MRDFIWPLFGLVVVLGALVGFYQSGAGSRSLAFALLVGGAVFVFLFKK